MDALEKLEHLSRQVRDLEQSAKYHPLMESLLDLSSISSARSQPRQRNPAQKVVSGVSFEPTKFSPSRSILRRQKPINIKSASDDCDEDIQPNSRLNPTGSFSKVYYRSLPKDRRRAPLPTQNDHQGVTRRSKKPFRKPPWDNSITQRGILRKVVPMISLEREVCRRPPLRNRSAGCPAIPLRAPRTYAKPSRTKFASRTNDCVLNENNLTTIGGGKYTLPKKRLQSSKYSAPPDLCTCPYSTQSESDCDSLPPKRHKLPPQTRPHAITAPNRRIRVVPSLEDCSHSQRLLDRDSSTETRSDRIRQLLQQVVNQRKEERKLSLPCDYAFPTLPPPPRPYHDQPMPKRSVSSCNYDVWSRIRSDIPSKSVVEASTKKLSSVHFDLPSPQSEIVGISNIPPNKIMSTGFISDAADKDTSNRLTSTRNIQMHNQNFSAIDTMLSEDDNDCESEQDIIDRGISAVNISQIDRYLSALCVDDPRVDRMTSIQKFPSITKDSNVAEVSTRTTSTRSIFPPVKLDCTATSTNKFSIDDRTTSTENVRKFVDKCHKTDSLHQMTAASTGNINLTDQTLDIQDLQLLPSSIKDIQPGISKVSVECSEESSDCEDESDCSSCESCVSDSQKNVQLANRMTSTSVRRRDQQASAPNFELKSILINRMTSTKNIQKAERKQDALQMELSMLTSTTTNPVSDSGECLPSRQPRHRSTSTNKVAKNLSRVNDFLPRSQRATSTKNVDQVDRSLGEECVGESENQAASTTSVRKVSRNSSMEHQATPLHRSTSTKIPARMIDKNTSSFAVEGKSYTRTRPKSNGHLRKISRNLRSRMTVESSEGEDGKSDGNLSSESCNSLSDKAVRQAALTQTSISKLPTTSVIKKGKAIASNSESPVLAAILEKLESVQRSKPTHDQSDQTTLSPITPVKDGNLQTSPPYAKVIYQDTGVQIEKTSKDKLEQTVDIGAATSKPDNSIVMFPATIYHGQSSFFSRPDSFRNKRMTAAKSRDKLTRSSNELFEAVVNRLNEMRIGQLSATPAKRPLAVKMKEGITAAAQTKIPILSVADSEKKESTSKTSSKISHKPQIISESDSESSSCSEEETSSGVAYSEGEYIHNPDAIEMSFVGSSALFHDAPNKRKSLGEYPSLAAGLSTNLSYWRVSRSLSAGELEPVESARSFTNALPDRNIEEQYAPRSALNVLQSSISEESISEGSETGELPRVDARRKIKDQFPDILPVQQRPSFV